jgi:hypothetical protein
LHAFRWWCPPAPPDAVTRIVASVCRGATNVVQAAASASSAADALRAEIEVRCVLVLFSQPHCVCASLTPPALPRRWPQSREQLLDAQRATHHELVKEHSAKAASVSQLEAENATLLARVAEVCVCMWQRRCLRAHA